MTTGIKKLTAALTAALAVFTAALPSATAYAADEVIQGDANSDGVVNSKDAVSVLKYLAGNNKTISKKAADVNNDGKITADDAVLILRKTAGVTNSKKPDNFTNSIRLFDSISEGKEQSMFSPLSLNMALGLIESGASGTSRTALDNYLGTENYANFAERYMKTVKEKYNREFNDGSKYKDVFEIANSMWGDIQIPFSEEYKTTIAEKFSAEVENIDFSAKSKAIKTINDWCSEKTHKMIPEIINDCSDDLAAVLINTIYFESGWVDEWYINEENKEAFTTVNGKVNIPFMRNSAQRYFENDKATAFGERYKNGLEFIGILPNSKGDFTLGELDIPSLLKSGSTNYIVNAKMPRLNFESTFPLKEPLKAAGLSDIFNASKADFRAMSSDPEYNFYVSDVIQKTKLELDEKGTKAAAATMITMDTAGIIVDERETREVYLDRAFAFLIYDPNEEQIVFMGKVLSPLEAD